MGPFGTLCDHNKRHGCCEIIFPPASQEFGVDVNLDDAIAMEALPYKEPRPRWEPQNPIPCFCR